MFCVFGDVAQFSISQSLLSTAVASVFTSLRAFRKVCSTHSSPHTLQAACILWKYPECHGTHKHSTVTAEALLETFVLVKLKLKQNIWSTHTPYLLPKNTFGMFLLFLINKHKIQWQITMNRALSYLKHEFTASVWKIPPLPSVTAETNKIRNNSNTLLNFGKKLQGFILLHVTTLFTYPGKMSLT